MNLMRLQSPYATHFHGGSKSSIFGMSNLQPIETPIAQFSDDGPSDEEIRLRALNHTKDRLMSIVGHDLRTAIGGVLSLTTMLDKRIAEGDLEDAQRLNGLMRRTALDADDLLKDLVSWARTTHQEHEFQLESIEVGATISTEIERLKGLAMQKNQEIFLNVSDGGMIRADPYMLSSILRNLISNALKFSYVEGIVEVKAERKSGYWLFSIADTGIGMPEHIQELLLKIDERKRQTGTSGEKGSGFGLLLCEDFIARHGGKLTWTSSPGEGSTFSFTIPELIG